MPRKRSLELDSYNISKHRYKELANFCLQYREFIQEKNECYYSSGKQLNKMPKGNYISNPTANKAERAYKLSKNIELIEQTAIEASGELYPWILQAVTAGLSWEYLRPPCGINQFYETRRRFFYLLNFKK